jgi:hypothetical protein
MVIVLLLMLFGMLKNDIEWAIFPAMGMIIGIYFTISLWADGSITQVSGGSTITIAAASLVSTSAWQFLSLIPLVFTASAGLVSAYKVGKSI